MTDQTNKPNQPQSETKRLTGGAHLSLTMSALTLVGGVAGYASARSTQSLFAGLLFGGGFGYSAYLIQNEEQVRGFRLATVNSVLLSGIMALRYARTRKAMPALPLTALGIASAYYHGNKYIEWS
jgi:uncharacterized membrane protein (UPF0136 family)